MELERKVRDSVPGDLHGAQPDWAALRARWLANYDVRAALASAVPTGAENGAVAGSFDASGARALACLRQCLADVNPTAYPYGNPGVEEVGVAADVQSPGGRG